MKKTMRICFLSFYFSPLIGGAETQSERQARQLQALGNDVTVVTLRADRRWKQRETLDGLPVVRVGGMYKHNRQLRVGRLGYLPCSIQMFLTLWCMRHQYDVIHVFQMTPLAAVAALIGKITHKPVIISIQSTGPSEAECEKLERGAMLMADSLPEIDYLKVDVKDLVTGDINYIPQAVLGGKLILRFLRNVNAYYHVNSARNYAYVTSHGFRAEQIVRIPHGVDTEKFRPVPDQWTDMAKPERTIVCVARLDYAKGVDILLHAWGRMMHEPAEWRAHLKPRLHVVGEGTLRAQLERIVVDLGIEDSVEFLGLRRDIPDLLQQAWGYVQPSRWESLPNALLEAMACGLPCVATRVSGSEDIISDGINGFLVEIDQPAAMARALRRIIEDSSLAQQLGHMAHATIIPNYQLPTVVKRFYTLYQHLIAKNGIPEALSKHFQEQSTFPPIEEKVEQALVSTLRKDRTTAGEHNE